jgi:hypothetical protein
MRMIKWIGLTALFIFLDKMAISQQLRLGDNPYSVEKSAVLDLVSTNQGLLLPRITDTTLINALNPPNGMIIYYAPGNKLLVRTNGNWQPVISQDVLKLSNLGDASLTLPQSGQILEYNGSAWVNYTPPYLTTIDTSNISNFSQKVRGLFTGITPIVINANGQVSITQAGASSDGYLSSSDWNTFNNKQPADNYLTGLTGDVNAAGPGTVAATITPNAVTYSKMQNVSATDKVLGRVSSGSGVIEEISTTGSGNVVRSNAPVLNHPTGLTKDDVGLSNVDNTADTLKPISNATQAALNLKINLTQKGANNGVATLDAGGKVPLSQLAIGAQVYLGTWSAVTNTPHVQDGVGSAGDTYRVVEGGTIDLGSGPITLYASDDIIYNGTIWQRNPATSQVTSVNGQAGTVVLTSDDINEGYTNKYYTDTRANLKINVTEKGANNGVATLDAGGKVPASQLPVGAQVYKGTWDASTNSPTLVDGTGSAGWTYRVTVAGTQNLGSGAITFSVGDDIIYNGTIWQRNPSSTGVSSVNSQTGTVVLTTDDVNEGNNNKYYADSLARHAISASLPLSYNSTNGNFTISQASTSSNGYLSSIDWNTFNSKQPSGNYITDLTGDIIASGPGSVGATIAPNAVTYSKMQSMTANKLLGSGLSGTSVSEITLGTGLSFTGNTLNAATTGGTITSFSSGDLSPLFTTSVSNPTTTPALSFSFNSQAKNLLFASPVSTSGTPTFRSLVKADLPSTGVYNDQSNTYTSGSKQIFSASNINADIRLTGNSSDPSTLSNGDIWYNSTSNVLKYRANATTRTIANLDEAQTFTNKTISGSNNTITNIGNSSLTNSTIGLTLGTSGTDVNVSNSPASLGSSITLNIPSASATNRGLLTAADWTAFNNKLNSIDTTSVTNFYLKVRSLLSAGSGITYNNSTGMITNSGVTSINSNTGALTMDTGYINNFYLKIRSLHSVSAPLTYNSSTGVIGITQANSTTNGYLSSTDWNTFNNKAGSFSTGNLTETGSGVLTITGGTGSVIGSGTTVQVKQATTSQSGFLSSTDWNTFNNKLSSVDTSSISNFYLKVRSLLSGGTGISYNNSIGVITNSGVTSLNGNTGALTMDTGYISNFYLKTRGLLSAGSGISYNAATGAISATLNGATLWNLTGNAGTTAGTNFIGTTDNQDLVFKTNNTEAARIVSSTGDIKIGSATTGTIRATQELVLRQDGDIYGPSILRLRNRNAENGAIFETTDPTTTLVDFIFKTAASQRNIRFEARSAMARAGTPSFHIGGASPDNPTLAVGDSYAAFATNLKIGNYSTPTEALDVTGNIRFSGALMPNNNAGSSGYVLTSNGTNTPPTWINLGLGNLSNVSLSSPANGQILQYNGTNWVNSTPSYLTTIDTSNISNFYLKVRSLHSSTAPITYNSTTGAIGITQATTSTNGYLSSADWNTFNNKASAYTFSTGLTNTSNTITNNLSTGISASNQNIYGSTASGGTLTLNSTTNAIKGKILFGNSAYDESNNYLAIGNTTTQNRLTIGGGDKEAISRDIRTGSLEIMGGTSEATGAYFQITGDQHAASPYEGSAEFVIRDMANSQFGMFSYDGASTWTQRFQLKGATGDTYLTPNGGKVSVGGITPTAYLHLRAGTATANTAPLKFTAGTNLSSPEDGAIEYNGSHFYATIGSTRYQLDQQSSGGLSDPGGNGILARTSLNTTVNRTITGTSNRIILTNGDGVSGNPTIDISSSYVGQSSITTLGTITTGTWHGTALTSAYLPSTIVYNDQSNTYTAGSKQIFDANSTSADIRLLGNTTDPTTLSAGDIWYNTTSNVFKGRFNTTTRQFATLDGAETFTNKTFSGSTNTLGGVTMSLGSDATGDVYYRNSSGVLTRLAAGSDGDVLSLNGGVPSWSSAQPLNSTFTALTASATVTLTPAYGTNVYTLTPAQNETFNIGTIPAACVGQIIYLIVTTSGTISRTITFNSKIRDQGTLSTGTAAAKKFVIQYLIESTSSVLEISRTIAL